MSTKSISIIIPTLNESKQIQNILEHLKRINGHREIIVSDGGSTDHTPDIAKNYAKVLHCETSRAIQMNLGAQHSRGDILWFIHADCKPHPKSADAIFQALENEQAVGGAFEYNLDADGFIYRISEFFSNRKNRLLNLIYGDMGIFVKRTIFEKMGGYKPLLLMEDLDFGRRLTKFGKIVILPYRINTSTRRWQAEGPIKNLVRNWILQILWAAGTPPEKLASWYPFNYQK
jgi:rSAM/selenodomain-associated transferase 2